MNKKGFTLIELLAVAVILGLMILAVVPNLLATYNQVKDKNETLFVEQMTEAAKIYAENNKKDIEGLEEVGGIAYITLQDIVNAGLLETPIINPSDNSEVSLSTLIKITRTANNQFTIEYDVTYP